MGTEGVLIALLGKGSQHRLLPDDRPQEGRVVFIIVTQGLAVEDEMAGLGIRELERRAK
jgi:hypothetical protein